MVIYADPKDQMNNPAGNSGVRTVYVITKKKSVLFYNCREISALRIGKRAVTEFQSFLIDSLLNIVNL